nr:PREDICTED: DNA polymerase eta-like [Bemisia tabaci]
MTSRVVALIDMDCFYCQVETRMRPELLGTPVAVVQYKTWKGGGIIAVNYEARAAGVTRFMRGDEAKAQCPSITLCSVPEVRGKADLTRYRDAGREVIKVFSEMCQCVERASIDEAFIDLTDVVEKRLSQPVSVGQLPNTFVVGFTPSEVNDNEEGKKGVSEWLESLYDSELDDVNTKKLAVGAVVVEEMRAAVYAKTGFRCSAGIAHNKIIAKLAAGLHKPNRQTVLPMSGVPILFSNLPVKKVRNLGGKLGVAVVEQLGCQTMADLAPFALKELQNRFDEKTGTWLYNIARGIDHEQVAARLIPKSIGCSKRFPGNSALATVEEVTHWLNELSAEVSERLKDDQILNNRTGKVLTVMAAFTVEKKWNSFTRSGPLHSYEEDKISETAMALIKKSNTAPVISGAWEPPLINLGLSVGKFIDTPSGFNRIKQFFSMPTTSKNFSEENPRTSLHESTNKELSHDINPGNKKQSLAVPPSTESLLENKNKEEEQDIFMEESSSKLGCASKSEQSEEKPRSFLAKYFKRRKEKVNEHNEISNEGSNISNDYLQNCESNEANLISVSEDEKPPTTFQNISSILGIKKAEDKPSTSFFQPDCNSTALDSSDMKNNSSDVSNDAESNDCWQTISEIFPDLDNIDLEVVQLLPKNLQDVIFSSGRVKIDSKKDMPHASKSVNPLQKKIGRGRPPKREKVTDKTLSQYFKSSELSTTASLKEEKRPNCTLSQFFSKHDTKKEHSDTATKQEKSDDDIDSNNPKIDRHETNDIEIDDMGQKDFSMEKNDHEEESTESIICSCDIFEVEDENEKLDREVVNYEAASAGPSRQRLSPVMSCDQGPSIMEESAIDMFHENKSSPASKLETEQENDSDVINKLTPVILTDRIVDLSTKKCSLCNEEVMVAGLVEHMDFHAAVSLDKELNSADAAVMPIINKSTSSTTNARISKPGTGGKNFNSSGVSTKRKKNQAGKSPKKSMNIASFFTAR